MRKKIILIILSVFLAAVAGGLYYMNKIVIPTVVKAKITTGLSDLTSGKVSMEKISFNLFKGVVITDLVLFEKDNPGVKLCSVKEASATFLILPFFKEKKIIVPTLKVKNMTFHLTRQKDNSLNISYLLEKFKPSGSSQVPSLLVKSVRVSDSSVLFSDLTYATPVLITLNIDNLSSNISWNKAILDAGGQVGRDDKKTDIRIKGSYIYAKKVFNGNLVLENLYLESYKEYFKELPLTLESGHILEAKADFSMDDKSINGLAGARLDALSIGQKGYHLKSGGLDITLSIQGPRDDLKKISYKGRVNLESGLFSMQEPLYAECKVEKSSLDFLADQTAVKLALNLKAAGINGRKEKIKLSSASLEADVNAAVPYVQNENISLSYSGTLAIKSGEISGIQNLDKISEIFSTIKFNNSDLLIEDSSAKILETPVKVQGHFKQNVLTLDVSGDFDLKKLLTLLPKEVSLPSYEASGDTNLNVRITSDFSKGGVFFFSGQAELNEARLRLSENNLNFETPRGQIKFDTEQENLKWHFPSIKYVDAFYSFDGSLKGFKNPAVSAMVTGKDLKVQTDLIKTEQSVDFSSLKGQFRNSKFNLKGRWDLKENMKANGTVSLDLADLKFFAPQSKETLEKLGLTGQCRIDAQVSGPLKDYRLWDVKADAQSSVIRCYGLKFKNVKLNYSQIKHNGFINDLSFESYNGRGSIKGNINLKSKNFTYSLKGILQDIDLSLLKVDTSLKDKTFFGIFSLNISLQGISSDLNTLKGDGAFTIKDGNVCEFNPLKGLGDFLFIPGFEKIVFTNAQGDFVIQDGFISTDNTELLGAKLGLIVEGKMSFGGDLDFLVNTQIPLTGQTWANSEVGQAISKAGSMTAIKITGTTKEPKYKLQAIGENIMKKLGDLFSNITP